MKKIILSSALVALSAGAALAADLPTRKEPLLPPPPPPPMWTGFYAGLNAGGTWSNTNTTVSTWNLYNNPNVNAPSAPVAAAVATGAQGTNNAGFIGGGQIGYNYQFNQFLVGLEADIQGVAGLSGSARTAATALIPNGLTPDDAWTNYRSVSNTLNYLGTVRGRVGYLVTPTVLIFGSGGLAYGGVSSQTSLMWIGTPASSFPSGGDTFFGGSNYSDTRVGWTAGGGLEWMFMPNWSAKVEYLYYDLGTVRNSFASLRPRNDGTLNFVMGTSASTRVNGNIARAGVNYHFNWGAAPVVAKF